MIDKSLRAILLPAPLIIKNFVKGEKQCNYEKYLLEFINKSEFFLKKSNGEYYSAPESEANGEYDCNSVAYKIDFKLIASQTSLEARSLLSEGKIALNDGGIIFTTSCKSKNIKSIETTRLFAALRVYTFEQLCDLKMHELHDDIEKDILFFLKTLETKKNILMFFPFKFVYDKEYEFEVSVTQIRDALSNDFFCSMKYRKFVVAGYETYMCFIYNEFIVFMQEEENKFNIVDKVKLSESPTYMKLLKYSRNF